jgi:hypothetical protein
MRVTTRQANSLSSERDSIFHHLGTLRAQEIQSTTTPRPRRLRSPPSQAEALACDYCNSTFHPTTECPVTPNLVYDHADTPPRLRRPDERVNQPASWHNLHQATLHYLVTSVLRYFRVLHDELPQRQELLRVIRTLLDIPDYSLVEPVPDYSLVEPAHTVATGSLPRSVTTPLFTRAVTELVVLLRASPFRIEDIDDPIFLPICARYYSPIFGANLIAYRTAVYLEYHS